MLSKISEHTLPCCSYCCTTFFEDLDNNAQKNTTADSLIDDELRPRLDIVTVNCRSIGAAVNIEISNVGSTEETLNIAIAERTVD